MTRHLTTFVPGQGETQLSGEGEKHLGESVVEFIGIVAAGQVHQPCVASFSPSSPIGRRSGKEQGASVGGLSIALSGPDQSVRWGPVERGEKWQYVTMI